MGFTLGPRPLTASVQPPLRPSAQPGATSKTSPEKSRPAEKPENQQAMAEPPRSSAKGQARPKKSAASAQPGDVEVEVCFLKKRASREQVESTKTRIWKSRLRHSMAGRTTRRNGICCDHFRSFVLLGAPTIESDPLEDRHIFRNPLREFFRSSFQVGWPVAVNGHNAISFTRSLLEG